MCNSCGAERLYKAIVSQRDARQKGGSAVMIITSGLVIDPAGPDEADSEKILTAVTAKLLEMIANGYSHELAFAAAKAETRAARSVQL